MNEVLVRVLYAVGWIAAMAYAAHILATKHVSGYRNGQPFTFDGPAAERIGWLIIIGGTIIEVVGQLVVIPFVLAP